MALDSLEHLPDPPFNTVRYGASTYYITLHTPGEPVFLGRARCHPTEENPEGQEYAVFGCQDGGNAGMVRLPVEALSTDDRTSVIPIALRTRAKELMDSHPDVKDKITFLYHNSGALLFPYTVPGQEAGDVVATGIDVNAFFATGKLREVFTTSFGLRGAKPMKGFTPSPDRPNANEIRPMCAKLVLNIA